MTADPSEQAAAANARWFGRENAFDFLSRDRDNVVRLDLVERELERLRRGSGLRLLDVGAGDGQLSLRWARLGYHVTALDASSEALERAQGRGIQTVLADVSRPLPCAPESFDVVYAGEIIEHLFDTRGFLAELHRVLVPGGSLLLTTPNLAHLPDRLRLLLGRSPMQVQPLHPFLKLHIRPFGPDTLRAALTDAGFGPTRLQSTLVVLRRDARDPDRVTLASRWLARAVPTLGSFLIATTERRS